jgi:hypothetical protein
MQVLSAVDAHPPAQPKGPPAMAPTPLMVED